MTELPFPIRHVSVSALARILEAVAVHPHNDVAPIAEFAGVSEITASRVLPILTALELVALDEQSRYVCRIQGVRRGVDEQTARQMLRRALLSYRPFEAICVGLAVGEDSQTAVRRAKVLLEIRDSDAPKLDLLIGWAVDLEILRRDDNGISLAILPAAVGQPVEPVLSAEDVESEAKARLFIGLKLGSATYQALDEHERELLADSLVTFRKDPASAAEKTGQAIENYLRLLAEARGLSVDARKANGAGQLANLLVSKGLLHNHQQKLVEAVGTVRNAKAHHKDKKTLEPWKITETAAFGSLLMALAAIRSIHELLTNGGQIL